MILATYGTPDELYHHGIKGQRWGVRRYQNYDGTLIKAGSVHRRKTRYTNIDGSLNEAGKVHSQAYINKQRKKNEKYYDKHIKKYDKLAEKYKDDKELHEKFKAMSADAKRSRDSVNHSIEQMGIDEIMSNERETRAKVGKIIAAGVGTAGAAALGTAGLAASGKIAGLAAVGAGKVGKFLQDFDPNTAMDKVIYWADHDPRGIKAQQLVEGGLRAYSDVRAYAIGIFADEAIKRMNQMGVTDEIGRTVGDIMSTAGNAAASGLNQNSTALLNQLSTVGNQAAPVISNQTSAILGQLASNPQYYEMLKQVK